MGFGRLQGLDRGGEGIGSLENSVCKRWLSREDCPWGDSGDRGDAVLLSVQEAEMRGEETPVCGCAVETPALGGEEGAR